MTAVELKEKIIGQIKNTDDEELLEYISRTIDFELHSDEVHIMSSAENEAVNEGVEQLKNGQWVSHKESNKRALEWLKKYDGQ